MDVPDSVPGERPILTALDATAILIPGIAAAMVAASYVLLGSPVGRWPVVLAASGAWLVYLADRAWLVAPEDAVNRPARLRWHRTHSSFRWIATAVALGLALFALNRVESGLQVAAAVLALPALWHLLPLSGHRAKEYPILKPMLVAGAWAAGAAMVPVLSSAEGAGLLVAGLFLVRFSAVAANVLASDVHDVAGDEAAGIRSLAGRLGEYRTRRITQCIAATGGVAATALWSVTTNQLWAVELAGCAVTAFLLRPGRPLPSGVVLDLLVGWPAVTLAFSLA